MATIDFNKFLSNAFSVGICEKGIFGDGLQINTSQRAANALFDVAWTKEFEMDDEAVYQEDRFGVPCEVLRYEAKYPKMDKVKATYVVDPSVPF